MTKAKSTSVPQRTVVAIVLGLLAGITFVSTSSMLHGDALTITQAVVAALNVGLTSLGVHVSRDGS